MTLAELIARLEAADPTQAVKYGFTNPHSYRGDYMDLAFEPAADVTVAEMLSDARSALGTTYQGWKGGDFTMGEHTWCWLSTEGDASGETIGALLLDLMLAVPAGVAPATDPAALRERIITALNNAHHTHPCPALGDEIWSGCVHYDEAGRVAGVGSCHSGRRADAVLAVLPASIDRAAVLQEAAGALDRYVGLQSSDAAPEVEGARLVIQELRRMAGEPQPAPAEPGICGHRSPEGHLCNRAPRHLGYHRRAQPDSDMWTSWVGELPKPAVPSAVVVRRAANETQSGEPIPPSPRCAHCNHPKRDHDGRADHRAKFSPLVAGEPWCHACNTECDYAEQPVVEAQQPMEPTP